MKSRVIVKEIDLTPIDEAQELLIQVRDFLREKLFHPKFLGPYWYQEFWVLELEGKSPSAGHDAVWIQVNLEDIEITIAERKNGRTSRMDLNLYEEDCFERLANATKDIMLGKW